MRIKMNQWICEAALAALVLAPWMHGKVVHAEESGEQVLSTVAAAADQPDDALMATDSLHEDHDADLNNDLNNDPNPEANAGRGNRALNHQCQWYHGNPYQCQRFAGCFYDYRLNQCLNRGGGQPYPPQPYPPQPYPPQPYFCQQFNYNQFECQRQGCFFDYNTQLCFAPGGGPQPLPPPGHGRFVCTAVDITLEGHYNGHRGVGQTQYAAQQAAMGDCLRYHRQCRVTQCQFY
jgi:hypothetical protein